MPRRWDFLLCPFSRFYWIGVWVHDIADRLFLFGLQRKRVKLPEVHRPQEFISPFRQPLKPVASNDASLSTDAYVRHSIDYRFALAWRVRLDALWAIPFVAVVFFRKRWSNLSWRSRSRFQFPTTLATGRSGVWVWGAPVEKLRSMIPTRKAPWCSTVRPRRALTSRWRSIRELLDFLGFHWDFRGSIEVGNYWLKRTGNVWVKKRTMSLEKCCFPVNPRLGEASLPDSLMVRWDSTSVRVLSFSILLCCIVGRWKRKRFSWWNDNFRKGPILALKTQAQCFSHPRLKIRDKFACMGRISKLSAEGHRSCGSVLWYDSRTWEY